MSKEIIFLVCIFSLFFLALTLVSAVNINSCQELNNTNTIYTLTGNAASNETCFNITANNVTLDCQGFQINYSGNGTLGYGVVNLGQNFTTIKNCIIKEGKDTTDYKHGIYFTTANNGTIQNNTITILGTFANGILIYTESNYNTITLNNITTLGSTSDGIRISLYSSYNTATSNDILTTRSSSYGIYLLSFANFNRIANNTINTLGFYAYGLSDYISSNFNLISSNNIATLGNSGSGIYVAFDSASNVFTLNNITTSGADAYGIKLALRSANNSFSNMNIKTNNTGNAICIDNAHNNFTISDSILNQEIAEVQELYIKTGVSGNWNFTNVTKLDTSSINVNWLSGENSILNTHWYLDVNISNTTSQVDNANISLRDRNNNLLFSELTDINGRIARRTILEYSRNSTESTFYTNFNLTVTKSGFNDSILSINLTSNQFRNVVLFRPGETIYPTLTIFSPIDTTYYTNQSITVEFSADPSYQEMWYTIDGGVTNLTYPTFTTINFTTNGSKSIVFYANSTMGNVSSSLTNFSIVNLPANTTLANLQSSLETNNSIERVVLVYKSPIKTIEVPTNFSNKTVAISLKQITSNFIASLKDISLNLSRASITNNSVEFQVNTTITGETGWDGSINMPIVNDSSFSISSGKVNTAITIGSNSNLNLSKPAKIVIGNMYGKSAAWSEDNLVLTEISSYCNNITNPTNIQANGTRECYINSENGQDLIIWSYHLSTFAAYTPEITSIAPTTTGGGGTYTPADYSLTQKQLEKGYSQILGKDESMQFELDGKIYFVKIKKIDNLKAIVTISDAIQITLINGEERIIDVILFDKTYTLYMKVDFINSADKIGLTIKKIGVKDTSNGILQATGSAISDKTSNYGSYPLIILILAIIAVMFIILFVIRKRKL